MVSLSDYLKYDGVILVFTCNECPVAKAYEQRIIELDKEFASQGYPVLAINSNDPGMVYIGAIDDNQRKPESVKNAYVKEAIQALESGKKPKNTETMAVGCAIKYRK